MKRLSWALAVMIAVIGGPAATPAAAQRPATTLPYPPLPKAPDPWAVRELVQLPEQCVRVASDGKGKTLYCLGMEGNLLPVPAPAGGGSRP